MQSLRISHRVANGKLVRFVKQTISTNTHKQLVGHRRSFFSHCKNSFVTSPVRTSGNFSILNLRRVRVWLKESKLANLDFHFVKN